MMAERLTKLLDADKRSELRGALTMLNAVDIAQYLSDLESDKMLKVFRILPGDISPEVFSYMDEDQQQKLIESISDQEVNSLVSEMFIDDAVDFLEDMPAELVKRVLANVPEDTRKTINRFLRYPENSAGSIMTIEYIALPIGLSVIDAMRLVRKNAIDSETINTLYVIDEDGKLSGYLTLRKLIMAYKDVMIRDIMNRNVIKVTTLDDQELAAQTMRKYDLTALPVVDRDDRLVGIVTADDIMDVIEDEATEDIEKMSALLPSEDEYMKSTTLTLAKNRLPWLMFMMASSILCQFIISGFSAKLTAVFAACIPMLMDTGGNCGSQASTLTIRGLALGEITLKDAAKVLWKEVRVSLIVAAVLAVVNFGIQMIFSNGDVVSSLIICAAMVCTVVLAKALGSMLPLIAQKLKLDPALMASPLVTTIVDVCSLMVLVAMVSLAK